MCRRRVSHGHPLAGGHRLEGGTGHRPGLRTCGQGLPRPPEGLCPPAGQGVGGPGALRTPEPGTPGTQPAAGARRRAAKARLLRAAAPRAGPGLLGSRGLPHSSLRRGAGAAAGAAAGLSRAEPSPVPPLPSPATPGPAAPSPPRRTAPAPTATPSAPAAAPPARTSRQLAEVVPRGRSAALLLRAAAEQRDRGRDRRPSAAAAALVQHLVVQLVPA